MRCCCQHSAVTLFYLHKAYQRHTQAGQSIPGCLQCTAAEHQCRVCCGQESQPARRVQMRSSAQLRCYPVSQTKSSRCLCSHPFHSTVNCGQLLHRSHTQGSACAATWRPSMWSHTQGSACAATWRPSMCRPCHQHAHAPPVSGRRSSVQLPSCVRTTPQRSGPQVGPTCAGRSAKGCPAARSGGRAH